MTAIYNAQKWNKQQQSIWKTSAKKSQIQKYIALWSFRWKKSCLNNILNLIYSSVNILSFTLCHSFARAQSFLTSMLEKNLQQEKLLVQSRNRQATCGTLSWLVGVVLFLLTLSGFTPGHLNQHRHTHTHTSFSLTHTHIHTQFELNFKCSRWSFTWHVINHQNIIFFCRLCFTEYDIFHLKSG